MGRGTRRCPTSGFPGLPICRVWAPGLGLVPSNPGGVPRAACTCAGLAQGQATSESRHQALGAQGPKRKPNMPAGAGVVPRRPHTPAGNPQVMCAGGSKALAQSLRPPPAPATQPPPPACGSSITKCWPWAREAPADSAASPDPRCHPRPGPHGRPGPSGTRGPEATQSAFLRLAGRTSSSSWKVSTCRETNVHQAFWALRKGSTRSQPGSLTRGQSQPRSLFSRVWWERLG